MDRAWKRRLLRKKKEKRELARRRRVEIKTCSSMLAKCMQHFSGNHPVRRKQAEILRRALDVLAGEAVAL